MRVSHNGRIAVRTSRRATVTLTIDAVQLAPAATSSYTIPPTTKLYGRGDVVHAATSGAQISIWLRAGVAAPPVGGHVALAPTADLPDGVLGTVERVVDAIPGKRLTVVAAAAGDVLADLTVHNSGALTPRIVDGSGRTVAGARVARDGSAAIRVPDSGSRTAHSRRRRP